MEVKKHRTNIEIVKDNWIKLQNLAALQNTSPTRIVNDLIDSYVNEKLPEDYQERIDERVNKVLDDKIDDVLIENIAARALKMLDTAGYLAVDIVDRDVSNTPQTLDANATTDIDSTNEINGTDATDITSDTGSTDEIDDRRSPELKPFLFKRYKASDNKKGYNDGLVAAKEGLSRESVRRYRKGIRTPKPDFVERWGLNWNDTQWVRN